MIALLCLTCGHRNPVGARFCNACGGPLHLKPCAQCEAFNTRAAAHCHQCGEAFTFDFAAMDVPFPDDIAADANSAPVEASSAVPQRSNALVGRIGALVAVIAVMVLLPAYLSHTAPDQERDDAATARRLQTVATPVKEETAATALRPAAALEPPAGVGVTAMPAFAAPVATDAPAAPEAFPSTVRSDAPALDDTGRAPQRSIARQAGRETLAWSPSAKDRRGFASRSNATRIAPQHPAASSSARAATTRAKTASPRPSPRPLQTDTLPGRWQRPCAEGRGLDAGCDVRLLAKGN